MKEELAKLEKNDFSDALHNDFAFKEGLKLSETRKELTPLSDETKDKLKEVGYSYITIESIGSEEEAKIYEAANVKPTQINGRDVLIKQDIDINQTDAFGRTNLERMENGSAPLDKNGKPIELHHIGQKNDSPLVELSQEEHRGKGNDATLHNKQKESEIDRENFSLVRSEHWKARAEEIKSQQGA